MTTAKLTDSEIMEWMKSIERCLDMIEERLRKLENKNRDL